MLRRCDQNPIRIWFRSTCCCDAGFSVFEEEEDEGEEEWSLCLRRERREEVVDVEEREAVSVASR